MGLFNRNKADSATASVADDNGKHAADDAKLAAQEEATEAHALEQHIAEDDPAAKAMLELESFRLTPGAKSLLDRAMDNVAKNDGSGIEDPDARIAIKQRAALVEAAGNDLSVIIAALCASCEDNPRDIAPAVYSLCFNILKSAVFIANLDYRRYLDPRADFDLLPYGGAKYGQMTVEREALGTDGDFAADQREETREAPAGLDSMVEREFNYFRETYGSGLEDYEDVFACALEDLRLFLQLTSESFGWDPDRPIPFAFIQTPEGTFEPINDPALALDHTEIKRKESLKRRREREGARMANAAKVAAQLVAKSLAR